MATDRFWRFAELARANGLVGIDKLRQHALAIVDGVDGVAIVGGVAIVDGQLSACILVGGRGRPLTHRPAVEVRVVAPAFTR